MESFNNGGRASQNDTLFQRNINVHSNGASVTASKMTSPFEFCVLVEVSDASVRVNRSICCHITHCLRQEKIGVVADVIAPCEWTLN